MSEEPSDAGPSVLIVEDDDRIASFMARALEVKGFAVERVAEGQIAIDRLAAGGIDLQVLDLGLPDLDGIEALRWLRDTGDPTPTAVVTARSDPRDREIAMELGARAYLTKPYALDDLIIAVRDGCGSAAPPEASA